jgi:transposase InsO family protein
LKPKEDSTYGTVQVSGSISLIAQWRVHYNTIRPHSSLNYRPPAPETLTPTEELPDQMKAA